MQTRILSALLLSLISLSASAAMYKWTDQNGQVHYGERPPTDTSAAQIKAKPVPKSSIDGQKQLKTLDDQVKKMEQDRKATEAKKADAEYKKALIKTKKKNCTTANENLAMLQLGGRRRTTLPSGEVKYLTVQEKIEMIAATRKQIEENCE